jgi:hypothetical protein
LTENKTKKATSLGGLSSLYLRFQAETASAEHGIIALRESTRIDMTRHMS